MPKILLIRFSSIGDIVLTSPIIRALKEQLKAEIHFLTKPQFGSLLMANPYISKVHLLQEDSAKTLKTEQFDYVVDLHKNLRSKKIIKQLGLRSHQFDKLNWEKWLLVNFKIDRLTEQHLVDRYFSGLAELGIQNDGLGLDFFIDEKQLEAKGFRFEEKDKNGIGLVLGAAHFTKQIPGSLLEKIIRDAEHRVLLLGGPKEAEEGQRLSELFGEKVSNFCGKTNIAQSALLIKNCSVVITPDTGMMHIASALKVPLVCVWGNTIPKFGMYPYYPAGKERFISIEQKELKCRPCSKIGKKKCPQGHFNCMLLHEAQDILVAANQLIGQ